MRKLMLSAATVVLANVGLMSATEACLDCRSRPEHYHVYGYGITNPGYFSGVRIRVVEPRLYYHRYRVYQHTNRHRHEWK